MNPALRRKIDFLIGVPAVYILGAFSKLAMRGRDPGLNSNPKKILVVKLAAIGDTVVLIPVLKKLRERYPGARICWLVSGINENIARLVPYIDDLIVIKELRLLPLLKLIMALRKEKFDIGIDFEQWSRTTALLLYFAGIPVRLGFNTKGQCRSKLFNYSFKKSIDRHELLNFYGIISVLGANKPALELELWETPEAAGRVDALFESKTGGSEKTIVIFHPGCGWDGKPREWPKESYRKLADALKNEFGDGLCLFITGGKEDEPKVMELSGALPYASGLAGALNLLEFISLVKRAGLVVSGNTSIVHIASAWKTPQVVLHGPTREALWGPINPNAVVVKTKCEMCPVLDLGFEYHTRTDECMRKIDFDEVLTACRKLLALKIH